MRDTKIPAFFPLPKKYDKINKRKTVMPIDIKMKGRKFENITDSPFSRLKENKNSNGYIAKNSGCRISGLPKVILFFIVIIFFFNP